MLASGVAQARPEPSAPGAGRRRGGGLRRIVYRLSWGLADQAVSSLTNFAIGIYIVREFGAVIFGAFTLAYMAYSLVLNASRAVASIPLVVRFTGKDVAAWRPSAAASTGTGTVIGIVGGVFLSGVATLFNGAPRASFLALGITLPGLLLQDAWRFAFIALGRSSQAFVNDLIWAVTLAPALLILRAGGDASVGTLVLVWGATGTIAGVSGILQARIVPSLAGVRAWLVDHRELGPRYLGEMLAPSISGQLRISALGGLCGLAAVGYLQAVNTLFGPITILFIGASMVLSPEGVRAFQRSAGHLVRLSVTASAVLAAGAVVWGSLLLILLPRGMGEWLLGPIWKSAYPLLIPTTLMTAGLGLNAGMVIGLRALGAARRSFRLAVIVAILNIILPILGAITGGVSGYLFGAAATSWCIMPVYWLQLRAALRDSRHRVTSDNIRMKRHVGQHRKADRKLQALSAIRKPANDV